MDFIEPSSQELSNYQELLKSENLCFEDLNDVIIVRVKLDSNNVIQAGYGLEIFNDVALLRSVVVSKNQRGNGLGYEVVKTALATAWNSGIQTLFLLTTTANLFFEKLGFYVIARESVPEAIANTNEFKDFCPDTAICMSLDLENLTKY